MGRRPRSAASSTCRFRARVSATSCWPAPTISGCGTPSWRFSRSRRMSEREAFALDDWRATACPYCGVGCGLLVQTRDGRVTKVKGDPDHPASLGDLCAKAVHLPPVLHAPDRLLHPHVRFRRDAPPARVPWELALRHVADGIREILATHGPDAVAFYASGQL